MRNYNCLKSFSFKIENYHIEPIRDEDKFEILKIRNEQIYHLRQSEPLTEEKQIQYFENVVSKLFEQSTPNQLLFSVFKDNAFIGYGGLVHINWIDKNAEISFIMKTELESTSFAEIWLNYLKLIEKVAFEDLNFHKIFTYAFDLRPHLYPVLLDNGFTEEARLKEHCFFDEKFIDVVYHCKMNRQITFRKANENDMMRYFNWTNDSSVRENSYQSEPISLENHQSWFYSKIKDVNCLMLVFEDHLNNPIGQVRIQISDEKNAVIGISTDENHRGKGYASTMIRMASDEFLKNNPQMRINAYIKLENEASAKAFEKAGYVLDTDLLYENIPSHLYKKEL